VRGTDLAEGGVGEQVVASFGERVPGLDLHAVLGQELLVVLALEEWVGLGLVDAAAVANAVHRATGVWVRDLPVTCDKPLADDGEAPAGGPGPGHRDVQLLPGAAGDVIDHNEIVPAGADDADLADALGAHGVDSPTCSTTPVYPSPSLSGQRAV
jgi:hypothetical protein